MPLQIYNTLTRRKEPFIPLREGRVGMYVCGPTVYGHAHIGHAKSYVSFDVVNRYLRFAGYHVTYVQNITDVGHLVGDIDEGEDKVEKEAKATGVSPYQVAQMYERSYWDDMDALGVLRPDISCRATGHMMEQIELIQTLIAKGHAYEVNGSVYFAVSTDKEYGKLSNRRPEDMEAGARVDVRSEKRSPYDFALWKKADPTHLMQWPSPWGAGYPGWHIECSAMSMKYLGTSFDIHGGGIENQFPHHECEIAQSECATEKPFVKYWMHNNMVTVGGKKMGKSLGNATNLKAMFDAYDPLALRFFILQSHYRSTLEYAPDAIAAAQEGLAGLHDAVRRVRAALAGASTDGATDGEVAGAVARTREEFAAAMDDDFNVPLAIGSLFSLKTAANSALARGVHDTASLQAIDTAFRELGGTVLGIVPEQLDAAGDSSGLVDGMASIIIDLRKDARARKDFAASDKIRDALAAIGVVLEDGKSGTTWKRK